MKEGQEKRKCLSQLRRLTTSTIGIKRGMSSPAVEARLDYAARRLFNTLKAQPDALAALCRGDLPEEITSEQISLHYNTNVEAGSTGSSSNDPPAAPAADAPAGPATSRKHETSRGFDDFCYMNKDMINESIDEFRNKHAANKHMARNKIRKKVAWKLWSLLSPELQAQHMMQAKLRKRERCQNGRFTSTPVDDAPLASLLPAAHSAQKSGRRTKQVAGKFGVVMAKTIKDTLEANENPAVSLTLRRLFTKCVKDAGINKTHRENLVPNAFMKRSTTIAAKPSGRPSNSQKILTPAIAEILKGHSTPSSTYSQRNKKSFRTLNAPLLHIWRGSAPLRKLISYPWLSKRARKGKMGFSKGSKRVDVCDSCYTWDRRYKGEVESFLQAAGESLKTILPKYFLELKEIVKRNEWDEAGFVRAESPDFMKQFIETIEKHRVICESFQTQ